MSPFKKRVIQIVKSIPEGKVASYGQVALYSGFPRGARQVGWILNGTEGKIDLPWWRVINNKGIITIKGTKYLTPIDQKMHLIAEGIEVSEELALDIEKYRWKPTKQEIEKFQ